MDDVFGCRHQMGDSLPAEQHQHACARLWLAVAATGSVALASRHSHAALLQNFKHLQHQHARPVGWRAAQQHRCWVCVLRTYKHTHTHRAVIHVELMNYKINSLLSIWAATLDRRMLNSTGWDAWSCPKVLTLRLGLNTKAARGKLRRANRGYTLKASIKRR